MAEEIKGYYTYNPEGAMALLDEAGLAPGADGVRLTVELDVGPAGLYDPGLAEIVKQYWKAIGLDLQVRSWDWPTTQARFRGGESNGLVKHNAAAPYEASNSLGWLVTGYMWNVTGNADPEFDALYQSILDAESREELMRLSREGNMYSLTNQMFIWTALTPWFNFTQPYVAGYDGDFYMGRWQKNEVFTRL